MNRFVCDQPFFVRDMQEGAVVDASRLIRQFVLDQPELQVVHGLRLRIMRDTTAENLWIPGV